MCKNEKQINQFYSRRNGSGYTPYCRKCTVFQATKRSRAFKQLCIQYKGSKCENCGYCKCNSALQFHHTDTKEKQFNISSVRNKKFTEKVKQELDKCILLCANCHRQKHNNELLEMHKLSYDELSTSYKVKNTYKVIKLCQCGKKKSQASKQCRQCYKLKIQQRHDIKKQIVKQVCECGQYKNKSSIRCKKCSIKNLNEKRLLSIVRKFDPTKQQFITILTNNNFNYQKVGRMYNVSGNAIKKRMKLLNIEKI